MLCHVITVIGILTVWMSILFLQIGILFNPWIYGHMLDMQKEKNAIWDKYLESNLEMADFNYSLSENSSAEDFIKALSEENNRINYTAVHHILYDNRVFENQFVVEATPYLISFLTKEGNLLRRDTIYLLEKFKVKDAIENVRPFLESDNPFLRIAAKEYFHTIGEDINPKTDKDYVDWDAKYDEMVAQNRIASVLVGLLLTILISGLHFIICKKEYNLKMEVKTIINKIKSIILAIIVFVLIIFLFLTINALRIKRESGVVDKIANLPLVGDRLTSFPHSGGISYVLRQYHMGRSVIFTGHISNDMIKKYCDDNGYCWSIVDAEQIKAWINKRQEYEIQDNSFPIPGEPNDIFCDKPAENSIRIMFYYMPSINTFTGEAIMLLRD